MSTPHATRKPCRPTSIRRQPDLGYALLTHPSNGSQLPTVGGNPARGEGATAAGRRKCPAKITAKMWFESTIAQGSDYGLAGNVDKIAARAATPIWSHAPLDVILDEVSDTIDRRERYAGCAGESSWLFVPRDHQGQHLPSLRRSELLLGEN